MNTINISDPELHSDPNSVGVDRNRLVVTTRPTQFGTFAVTTDENFTSLPYYRATSFRINNFTGKMIGIRRKHKKVLVEDFEDGDYSDWTGTVDRTGLDVSGKHGGIFKDLAHRPLTTEVMLDGSEVEVTFRTPTVNSFVLSIKVWDDPSRIGAGSPAANFVGTQATLNPNTTYRGIIRLNPSTSKYDTILDDGVTRTNLVTAGTGEFGSNNMQASVISAECAQGGLVLDPIIYQQKVNWSNEQMGNHSSFVFPCEDNTAEYEIANLGSDAMNYSDNTDNVSLAGFYAV